MKVVSWNSTHYTHLYHIYSSIVHKTSYKDCCEHDVRWDYWEGDVYPNCPMGDGVSKTCYQGECKNSSCCLQATWNCANNLIKV